MLNKSFLHKSNDKIRLLPINLSILLKKAFMLIDFAVDICF